MFCVFMWIRQNCSNDTLKIQNFQILCYSISDLYREKENVTLKIGGKVLPEVAQNWLLQESKSFLENIKSHAVDPGGHFMNLGLIHPFIPWRHLLAPARCQALFPAQQKRQGSCSYGAYILVGGGGKETSK